MAQTPIPFTSLIHTAPITYLLCSSLTFANTKTNTEASTKKTVKPQRIISTTLASDEILHAIVDDHTRLLASSVLATNPLHSNIHHLSQPKHRITATNIEQIVNLKPDLIVYSVFNRPEFIANARKLNIPTLVLEKFSQLNDILANIQTIGKTTGDIIRAQKLVNDCRRKLKHFATKTQGKARPLVLNFFADNTVMGKNTLFTDIITSAGGKNLAAERGISGFKTLNTETLLLLKPDFIVIPEGTYHSQQVIHLLQKSHAWRHMHAVHEKKFIFVPTRELMATSHHVMNAITKIHHALHPPDA